MFAVIVKLVMAPIRKAIMEMRAYGSREAHKDRFGEMQPKQVGALRMLANFRAHTTSSPMPTKNNFLFSFIALRLP